MWLAFDLVKVGSTQPSSYHVHVCVCACVCIPACWVNCGLLPLSPPLHMQTATIVALLDMR